MIFWRTRHTAGLDRRKRLEDRLNSLQQRKNRVVDAFLHEGKLDEATYDEQLRRLAGETEEVQAQLHAAAPERLDLDAALDFAEALLTDPAGCWRDLAPTQRPLFQRAVYPQGLRYHDGSFGTAESSWAFSYFVEVEDPSEGLVTQSRPSWNQTWEWLQAIEGLRHSLARTPQMAAGGP